MTYQELAKIILSLPTEQQLQEVSILTINSTFFYPDNVYRYGPYICLTCKILGLSQTI